MLTVAFCASGKGHHKRRELHLIYTYLGTTFHSNWIFSYHIIFMSHLTKFPPQCASNMLHSVNPACRRADVQNVILVQCCGAQLPTSVCLFIALLFVSATKQHEHMRSSKKSKGKSTTMQVSAISGSAMPLVAVYERGT